MKYGSLLNPSYVMYPDEYEAMKKAEREHALGVAVRMDPTTFRVEYYNKETGEIIK